MKGIFTLILACCLVNVFGQLAPQPDYLYWSADHKLTIQDFLIRPSRSPTEACYAQYTIGFQSERPSIWTGRSKIHVYAALIPSASWLDTSKATGELLRYQQTLFDMAELYARRMRKEIEANRPKLVRNPYYLNELDAHTMADLSRRRLAFDEDLTPFMREEAFRRWEQIIAQYGNRYQCIYNG